MGHIEMGHMGRSFGRMPAFSLPRLAVIAVIGASGAGCSTDANRLLMADSNGNPFANPFESSPATTGSVRPNPNPRVQAVPTGSVVSQNLPPPSGDYGTTGADAPPVYTPQRTQPYQGPVASAGGRAAPGWSANGGTVVTLRDGETVGTLAMRYGVPASAILAANGLRDSGGVRPGQQITIPVYSAGTAVSQGPADPASTRLVAAAPRKPLKSDIHVTESGDTLTSISRLYGVSPGTLASANQMPPGTPLKIGQRITIPGANYRPAVQMAVATPADTVRPIKAALPVAKPPVDKDEKPAGVMQVAYAPQQAPVASPVVPAGAPVGAVSKNTDSDAVATAADEGFRWPVRGRVISRFGAKPQGGTNDGINVAVPEGTAVKAAEDGTVAYVGSELAGFGNLVLVRHANGYVTAYAHNSELDVKKGEAVRRGQVIAKSGKTGSVTTPQLHFEIRKGSSAIDPLQKLETL